MYCQHAHKLRINRPPGIPDHVSERPRNRKTGQFLDGAAGTQVEMPADARGFDLGAALRSGAIAPLPCPEHPGEPPAVEDGRSARNGAAAGVGDDG